MKRAMQPAPTVHLSVIRLGATSPPLPSQHSPGASAGGQTSWKHIDKSQQKRNLLLTRLVS